ncbi:MAG: DUF58 domain-containing protein [Rhodospirillales bacterium]|nr:DUF58 domain-containing protein [Alphaproteobacteria bacterium]MBL6947643.1 DUF58 domain-containing protein [Rhodospirillales bacterium]
MAPSRSSKARSRDTHHKAEELSAHLPALMVAAERVAATVSQGVHGRRRVGQGETFWQFRRYGYSDSTQLIDWRQSAKSVPIYVRETEWEAAQSVWLWRDGSPSMSFSSSPSLPEKTERADLLLLALASLLIRGGEHVALLGTGMIPSTGRGMLMKLWSMIEAQEKNGKTPDANGAPGGLPGFEALPRYGRVVLIGDFLSPLDDLHRAVSAFANQGVRGHLVQVLDPAEETLPFAGRVRFDGMEGEGDVLIGRVEAMREKYIHRLERHNQGIEALAKSFGWSYAAHHTDHSPEASLMALYLVLSETAGR